MVDSSGGTQPAPASTWRARKVLAVFAEVAVAEEAQAIRIGGDLLRQQVVVFAAGVVAAGFPFVADHRAGHVVEGARVAAGAVEMQPAARPVRPQVAPAEDLAFGGRLPKPPQLVHREAGSPGVGAVHHEGQSVESDRQLDEGNAGGRADLGFLGFDRPRGRSGPRSRRRRTCGSRRHGAAHPELHRGAGIAELEFANHRFGNRENRTRAVDHRAAAGLPGAAGLSRRGARVAGAALGGAAGGTVFPRRGRRRLAARPKARQAAREGRSSWIERTCIGVVHLPGGAAPAHHSPIEPGILFPVKKR